MKPAGKGSGRMGGATALAANAAVLRSAVGLARCLRHSTACNAQVHGLRDLGVGPLASREPASAIFASRQTFAALAARCSAAAVQQLAVQVNVWGPLGRSGVCSEVRLFVLRPASLRWPQQRVQRCEAASVGTATL